MLETIFEGFLLVVVISLLYSIRTDKYKKELSETIEGLKAESETMKEFIETEFKLNFADTIKEIHRAQSVFVKAILWLSKDID